VKLLLFFQWIILCTQALAWPPELAPELNFSNADLHRGWRQQRDSTDTSNPENLRFQKLFKEAVEKKCGSCRIEQISDRYGEPKFRVTLDDGWHFDITMDPSVIEITAKPLLTSEIADKKNAMDNLIWGVAKEIGLEPYGAGHLNFGIDSTFGNDSQLFRNFLADYLNQPGLTSGIFDYVDNANAPHPEELLQNQRTALAEIFEKFDSQKSSIQDLAKQLYEKVYFRSTVFGIRDGEPPEKYQALNINSLVKEGDTWPRLELRAIGMQQNAEELIKLTKLFQARINFLKGNKKNINYVGNRKFREKTPKTMIEDFHRYVTESGLEWEEYRVLVSKRKEMQMALALFEENTLSKPRLGFLASENKDRSICSKFFQYLLNP
jgi:hypothetical protein